MPKSNNTMGATSTPSIFTHNHLIPRDHQTHSLNQHILPDNPPRSSKQTIPHVLHTQTHTSLTNKHTGRLTVRFHHVRVSPELPLSSSPTPSSLLLLTYTQTHTLYDPLRNSEVPFNPNPSPHTAAFPTKQLKPPKLQLYNTPSFTCLLHQCDVCQVHSSHANRRRPRLQNQQSK